MSDPIATNAPRRFKSLRSCCGCFSVRTGTIILSFLALVGSLINILVEWNIIRTGRFTQPDQPHGPNHPTPVDPSHPLPPVQEVRAVTLLLLANSFWNLLTFGFSALGFYGAIRNQLPKVKLYAYFNLVSVVFGVISSLVVLISFAVTCRDQDEVVTGTGKHSGRPDTVPAPSPLPPTNPELQLSCAVQTWSMAMGSVFAILLSVYYAACVYSYYVDLESHPTKYGVRGGIYLPVHDDDVVNGDANANRSTTA